MTSHSPLPPRPTQRAELPVVDFHADSLSPSTLQTMVAVFALSDPQGDREGSSRLSAFIDILCPEDPSSRGIVSLSRSPDSQTARIALRALLTRTCSEAAQYRDHGSIEIAASERHLVQVAAATADFVLRGNPGPLGALLSEGDLCRIALPAINTLTSIDGPYLVGRIPPHLGNGVTRFATASNAELIQKEMEWEAQQDRATASSLLEALMGFARDPTPNSLRSLLKLHSYCGEWRTWIAHPAQPDATHADAEQVIANTIALLESFQSFTAQYLRAFPSSSPVGVIQGQWFERDVNELPGSPPLMPLYAGVLEILSRQDIVRAYEDPEKYGG